MLLHLVLRSHLQQQVHLLQEDEWNLQETEDKPFILRQQKRWEGGVARYLYGGLQLHGRGQNG